MKKVLFLLLLVSTHIYATKNKNNKSFKTKKTPRKSPIISPRGKPNLIAKGDELYVNMVLNTAAYKQLKESLLNKDSNNRTELLKNTTGNVVLEAYLREEKENKEKLLDILFKHCAFNFCTKDHNGNTLLHNSVENPKVLKRLLAIAKPQDINEQNKKGETILHKAVYCKLSSIPMIIGYKTRVDILDTQGYTAAQRLLQNFPTEKGDNTFLYYCKLLQLINKFGKCTTQESTQEK